MAVNMDEAAKRLVSAGHLLLKGKTPPEVAKTFGAPRQTMGPILDRLGYGW